VPASTDIRIRWLLDVVDKGGADKLLRQDRQIRASLKETDTAYTRVGRAAVAATDQQTTAASRAATALNREGKAATSTASEMGRLAAAQREALTIGSRLVAQSDRVAGAYSRQAAAAKAAHVEQSRLARLSSGVGGALGAGASLIGGGAKLLGGAGLGLAATATGLTVAGLHRGTEIRAGAAGLAGITGVDAKTATALAVIAQAEQVSARGLGTAFATLGKQTVAFQKEISSGKPGKTSEAFKSLGIGPRQVAGLQNNLPGLFDLVFQRAQKLPAAQQASTLKTFLGRGANLGGQIELAGPLAKQIGTVKDQLGGLDPGKLAKLHETEIRLKEGTVGLELSFAQTFGPPLIALMDKITPAIKPFGDILKTAIVTPMEWLKQNAPPVISSIVEGFTGTSKRGAQGAPPILGIPGGTPAGRGAESNQYQREAKARAGAESPSTLQKIGQTIGSVARTVGTAAVTAGKQLLDAFRPALPFLKNVLLPLLIGVGKGVLISVVGAFKVLVPIIKVVATVLGTVGRILAPLKGVFQGIGTVIGIVFAGAILKAIALIGKVGDALGHLGFLGKLVGAPIRLVGAAFRFVGTILSGVGTAISKLPGAIKSVAGGAAGAAKGVAGVIVKGFNFVGSIPSKIVGVLGKIPGGIADVAKTLFNTFWNLGRELVKAIISGVKSLPGAIWDAIKGLAGKGAGILGKLVGKIPLRKGGRVGYAGGGMVDALVSPGEEVHYGGSVWTVPGARTAADSVQTMLPVGAAVLTASGQQMMSQGASIHEAISYQAPHFAAGGLVVRGKVSTFGPPNEPAAQTATGVSDSLPGVAIRPGATYGSGQPYKGKMWRISIGGHTGTLKQIDIGPNESTGRRIDVTGAGSAQLGIDPRKFPTDSIGTATLLGAGAVTSGKSGKLALETSLGRSRTRAGLIPDALQKGYELGVSGVTGEEIARANRGVRGAVGNPNTKAIAEAVGAVTRTVSIAKSGEGGGKAGKLPTGVSIPNATWNPSRKPIDRWIQPYLSYGAGHGWPGVVTSGFRTFSEQAGLNSGSNPKAAAGHSKHEQANYPGGAVDVTEAPRLASALTKKPGPHLLEWAGAADPVHFSHHVNGSYRRGGLIQRFAGGGVVGGVGKLVRAAGNEGKFTAAVARYEESLEAFTTARLNRMVGDLIRAARKGGPAKLVRAYQGAITAVEEKIGLRVGEITDTVTQRAAGIERGQGAVDRFLRVKGTDPSSVAGLTTQIGYDDKAVGLRRKDVAESQRAVAIAQKTKNQALIKQANDGLTAAQEALDEAITKGIEDKRALLRQAAQDVVDRAQFGVSSVQNARAGLDIAHRLSNTAETPQSLREKASMIEGSLVPTLQKSLGALNNQLGVLQSTGASQTEIESVLTSIQTAGTEIAGAFADAAELVRQAAETAAEEVVEGAAHRGTLASTGQQKLELEQRLKGTFDTGNVQRAEYIKTQITPALEAEREALKRREDTARKEGNVKLAEQIAEQIAGKQNDILQSQLDAQEQIANNTAQHKVGGQLGFAYGGETLADSIIAAGSGA
jgi:hypothetical protein